MTITLKYFAVRFVENGKEYEKLVGSNSAREASATYSKMFPDSNVLGVRDCNENDKGRFFRGIKSYPVS